MKILSSIKTYLEGRKVELIFVLGLVILAIALKDKIAVSFGGSSEYTKTITPVNRQIERDRLTCYMNRIPKEIVDFCDSQIQEGINVGGYK